MTSPLSLKSDVAYELIQVSVGALTLHTTSQTRQALDVLYVSCDLEALETAQIYYLTRNNRIQYFILDVFILGTHTHLSDF